MASYIGRRKFLATLGGAAAAWPLAARAQQPAMPVIGFMSPRAPEDSQHLLAAFQKGLAEGGFIEGRNVTIEYRWARGDYSRLPALSQELVKRQVDVLLGIGGDPSALAAKAATSTIPIVFGMGGDPVKAGLVDSFNRPGGNATGIVFQTSDIEPKRIDLLQELVPGGALLGAILNPKYPPAAGQLEDIERASRQIGRRVFVVKASNDAELDTAFAAVVRERVGALLVAADPYFDSRRNRIIAFAAQSRLPAIYQFREYAVAGGLISYGPSLTEGYRQYGIYAGRILKGAKPADLPVVQPTKFDFVINLKTAKALGFDIPPMLLARADEVIE
jgi:putative ABC transport system substrate-binding protein